MEDTKLRAFHNNPAIKKFYLERLEQHYVADQIIQRQRYWNSAENRGCAVGCTVHSNEHQLYESELGIPEILAHLEDAIFKGLPLNWAKEFPGKFLQAIPVGADLSQVGGEFMIWCNTDPEHGLVKYIEPENLKEIVRRQSQIYKNSLPTQSRALASWAFGAVARTAIAAFDTVYTGTKITQLSLTDYVNYVVADNTDVGVANAAREAVYVRQAEKLLELLRAAPIIAAA